MDSLQDKSKKVNEIEKDNDDIDLNINDNSKLYSKQRYYACDNSPCRNDPDNDNKSYSCCKYHTIKFLHHGMKLKDIAEFIKWYGLHAALAKLQQTNVKKVIKAVYTVPDNVLQSITTKQKNKITYLQAEIQKFIKKDTTKHTKYEAFVDQIYEKLNRYKKKRELSEQLKKQEKLKPKKTYNLIN